MSGMTRRRFLGAGALGAVAAALGNPYPVFPQGKTKTDRIFRMFPHPSMPGPSLVYAADEPGDPFPSSISLRREGIVVPADFGNRRFSVNLRWLVEGFGYVWLSADNGGNHYSLADFPKDGPLVLNQEFARSRIVRNRNVLGRYRKAGGRFSSEIQGLVDLSEQLFEDSSGAGDEEKAARLADRALLYALSAGEKIEMEKARQDILRHGHPGGMKFGCESRQYVWAKSEEFTKRFAELFNFATVTHYVWDTWYELFEPSEGRYNWGIKDNIVNWLTERGIAVEGRPLFWFHPSVTPDWLKEKSFDGLKRYVEKHTHDLVAHYGDRVSEWEVVNEYHDWANIHNHNPEQITEIVRLACDKTRETGPAVTRIINNCCPWAEYAARGRMARMDATRPLRSPRRFMQELIEAGVDFEVLGLQVYFPQRDLSDIVRLIERFEALGKPLYITETGATSGPTAQTVLSGRMQILPSPFDWHRAWDQ
ncbi:endo-1,4-beta-xylanase, partial [bacterium]|nr:endo-1,4-beta-xylanase [bacterium]